MNNFDIINSDIGLIKAWTKNVPVEESAKQQLRNLASLPFIFKHVVAMPDVHWGLGATVGSVIATKSAIIPAAVGVDIGCGMMAVKTSIKASDLPDCLYNIRACIESAIPHGRTDHGGRNDRGSWRNVPQLTIGRVWNEKFESEYNSIIEKHPKSESRNTCRQLGTLGSGNHFIELCLDEDNNLWVMLHSGSRGLGNRIGTYFINLAKKDMERWFINLPDKDLAYIPEGSELFKDYIKAVDFSQRFAFENRKIMMNEIIKQLHLKFLDFKIIDIAINCHHNYVTKENHFNSNVWVTRKGAVRAREGDLGIIPGSMGERSFIVRGKGEPQSFNSCAHGAGRVMSRREAKKKFTVEDHILATQGVECRKDKDVIDETPKAYKNIDDVMKAQSDLVDIIHTLKQIVCIKG